MAPFIASFIASLVIFLLPYAFANTNTTIPKSDLDLLEFPLNLEYLEAEFFLYGSLGHGLDKIAPNLTAGGPSPIGAKKANLDPLTKDVILQFAYQEVGHLRAIKKTVKGFPRPLLDLSAKSFAKVINSALGKPLEPPFDPYADSINYLIASYLIPYVGLTGYVGANPKLEGSTSKRLVAGLLGVESGQDAVIRGLLYERANEKVKPYDITVAEFTNQISRLRNELGHGGVKDEGLVVPKELGAEGKIKGNVLAGNEYSISYDRTPEEILRIVYGTGDEKAPGGFYPKGADAEIHVHHWWGIGGVVAGILGFTGLTGFIYYFLVMAITSAGLIAKTKFSVNSYLDCWNRILLDGFSGLMSFVLFWTFAYDIVHKF